MAISVSYSNYTVIDNCNSAGTDDADGNVYGTIGTDTNFKAEGTASFKFQSKGTGIGFAGSNSSNYDLREVSMFFWVQDFDNHDTEDNGGYMIAVSSQTDWPGAGTNYYAWTVGGQDTLRATYEGFLRITGYTERYKQAGAQSQVTATSNIYGVGGYRLTNSGQNTMLVDQIVYAPTKAVVVVTGTDGDSSSFATADLGWGFFTNISGAYFILSGIDFGDTGTAASSFADSGETWVFQDQFAAYSHLYTLTFDGGTGTNTVTFGSGSGSGDTETGAGGNTFIASRQPFNIVATSSDITTSFFGCSFLNSNMNWGTIRLENVNVKAVSSLFANCGQITVDGAAIKSCTISSQAYGVKSAIELADGTVVYSTLANAEWGLHLKGQGVKNIKNNTVSGNEAGYFFDSAQEITINADQFSGNTYDIENGGLIGICDYYPESNYVLYQGGSETHTGTQTQSAQSFTGDGGYLVSCKFYVRMSKNTATGSSALTGTWRAHLYAHSGTYGSSSVPTGAALATSYTVSEADIYFAGNFVLHEFVFPKPYIKLEAGTYYVIAIESSSITNGFYLTAGGDSTTPTHGGNLSRYTGTWAAASGRDLCFYVYTMTDKASPVDSYLEDNQSENLSLNNTTTGYAQSFTGDGSTLKNATFYLKKTNTPTGNMTAVLYAHSGTYGTSSVPTGTALATSLVRKAENLTTSYALHTFEFPTGYTLADGTNYTIAVFFTGTATNTVEVGADNSAPTHGGNRSAYTGTWAATAGSDVCFYVNGWNAQLCDSYSETNRNAQTNLDGDPTAVGQSFTGIGGVLTNVQWLLQRTGTLTSAVCKIYAHSGTYGTSSVPTGSPIATSDTTSIAAVSTTDWELTQFQFTDEYELTEDTYYVAVLEYTGTGTDYLEVGTDTTTPTHGGNFSTYTSPTWTAVAGTDACFYVSTGGLLTLNLLNNANPSTYLNSAPTPGAVKIVNAVTVTVGNMTEGTPVVIYAAETAGGYTDGQLLSSGIANSSGQFTYLHNYDVDLDVTIRARNQGVPVAAISDDNGSYVDETAAANNSSEDDMSLLPATPVANQDGYYFGHTEMFTGVKLWITTPGKDLCDSYTTGNGATNLDTESSVAQSFTGDGQLFTSCQFRMRRVGTLTGKMRAKLYSHSGTYGTSSVPGTLLATSLDYDPNDVGTTYENVTFYFPESYTLGNGTYYVIAFEVDVPDVTNYIGIYRQGTGGLHSGNYSDNDGGSWTPNSARDLWFNVYTTGTITWQYWNGSTWSNLTGVIDNTFNFGRLGEHKVTWTIPGDWDTTTVNSQGPYYYVRARFTAGGFDTAVPKARQGTLGATRYLPFPLDAGTLFTITSTGLTVQAVWTEDTIAQF